MKAVLVVLALVVLWIMLQRQNMAAAVGTTGSRATGAAPYYPSVFNQGQPFSGGFFSGTINTPFGPISGGWQ